MADLSDVENAIVSQVIGALYPLGISQASIAGSICRVYRGWPAPASLNSDLASGMVNVTIFPANVPDEVPPHYFDPPQATIAPTTVTAAVDGEGVTFAGTATINQVVGLLVDGTPFIYNMTTNDTPQSLAANLGTLICVSRLAIWSGSTLSIPGVGTLIARVVTNGTFMNGVRRQRREVQVNCWCPSIAVRDLVAGTVDVAIATVPFVQLSDGTKAHICYVSTHIYDQSQNALLYRRDLRYRCEYTMTDVTEAPVMLFGELNRNQCTSFV